MNVTKARYIEQEDKIEITKKGLFGKERTFTINPKSYHPFIVKNPIVQTALGDRWVAKAKSDENYQQKAAARYTKAAEMYEKAGKSEKAAEMRANAHFGKSWKEIRQLADSGNYNDIKEVKDLIEKFKGYEADKAQPKDFDAVRQQLEGLVAAHEHFGKSWPEIATQVEGLINKFGNNENIQAEDLKAAEDLMWKLVQYPGEIPCSECGTVYSQKIYLDGCAGVLFKMNLLKTNNVQNFIFTTLEKCIEILESNDATQAQYYKIWDLVNNGIVGEISYEGSRDKDTLKKLLNIDQDKNAQKEYEKKWMSLVDTVNKFDSKFYPTTQDATSD